MHADIMDARSSLDETITLAIGKQEDPKTLVVHKKILCSASPFFEAACKPEWLKEGAVIQVSASLLRTVSP
jgi:hypothetical protein